MGGKKKTKWRKLPLEEFTKEIPVETEKVPPADACPTDLTREESNCISSCSEIPEAIQTYADPQEYFDGLWYSTSCVVYNPGVYSSYMMPVDTPYYYYTMPEAGQIQEYMPVPYQEYTSALPKDTVYLLFPAQTLRPTQPVPNIAPEWQTRRRRRRFEGYAEYPAVPDRSVMKSEVKDDSKASGQHVNSRRNSAQSNNFKRMTSFTETSEFDDFVCEPSQVRRKSSDTKKDSMSCANTHSKTGPNSSSAVMEWLNADSSPTSKKNADICGIHSKNKSIVKDKTLGENDSSTFCNELHISTDSDRKKENKSVSNELRSDISILPGGKNLTKPVNNSLDVQTISSNMQNEKKEIEQSEITDNTELPISEISQHAKSFDVNEDTLKDTMTESSKLKSDNLQQTLVMDKSRTTDIPKADSQSSLPDILSSLNKTPHGKLQDTAADSNESHLSDNVELEKGRNLKSKSLLSQTNYLPSFLSSEALHNEMEMELKQLQSLHSLQANSSIYKLAYDENVTDQSDSRSPSPVTAESQVPSSLTRNEIIIHEADSDSDAGSEDVELLPHRYESESFLNENKHLYVNRLSLAVELLRTRESLPYDDEFKRVVGENNMLPSVHTSGRLNLGFVEDSNPAKSNGVTKTYENGNKQSFTSPSISEVISQRQLNHSADSSNDSAIFSDIEFSSLDDELCEPGKEVVVQQNENQDDTEEIRSRYRRLGIQARHYLSPRAGLPFNPCFCCAIM